MTTILIITSEKSKNDIDSQERLEYVRSFCRALEAKLTNTNVYFTTYEDIITIVQKGKVAIHDVRNDLDIRDIIFVHFKNWVNDTQTAGMIARYLKSAHIDIYNSEVVNSPARTKIAQMVLLAQNGISVPDTLFAQKGHLKQLLQDDNLPDGFTLPFVMKANDGAKGNDNYLIKTRDEAIKILHEAPNELEFVLQTYHENDGDYRFLYVGLEEEPMVFLRRAGKDTHLNNTSQGGVGKLVGKRDVPSEYYDIAYRAAKATGREIGGVDILVDTYTGVPYVLEVNQTPALATGYGVDIKIQKFADLIKQHVAEEEE